MLRAKAEKEKRKFYQSRADEEWLEALEPLGTDSDKPFLELAPSVIGIFVKNYEILPSGRQVKDYYATESVGIASGILISALYHVGIARLTHTPSPMGFLNQVFDRPKNEHPFLLLIAGVPSESAKVPKLERYTLDANSSTAR